MVEERNIAARLQGKVQIGTITCRCTTRIDYHDLGPPRLARRHEPLVEHGMAPREVGSHKDHEIGFVQVLVCAGDRIRSKSTFVACDCGRHAKTRVCIDVGRADETLHQFICDVVVFVQQLAGDVKCDAVWSVFFDGAFETLRDEAQSFVPVRLATMHDG